jgi:hypothetical protein
VRAQKNDKGALLRSRIERLSEDYAPVVDLIYYHELSISEVTKIVGIPENTVKTRMFHARKKLFELLSAVCGFARNSKSSVTIADTGNGASEPSAIAFGAATTVRVVIARPNASAAPKSAGALNARKNGASTPRNRKPISGIAVAGPTTAVTANVVQTDILADIRSPRLLSSSIHMIGQVATAGTCAQITASRPSVLHVFGCPNCQFHGQSGDGPIRQA